MTKCIHRAAGFCLTCYNRWRRQKTRYENWEWYRSLKKKPCNDCNKIFDPVCMDFDHRNPSTKKNSPAHMMAKGYPRKTLELEISKCDLVCANCHRLRTAKKNGWQSSLQYPVYDPRRSSEELSVIKSKAQHKYKRPVVDQDGNRYESIAAAARALNVWPPEVYAVLSGKRSSIKGVILRYA